jgi:diguanylate cyclase (GGDEF)-like protein/PAS domain S-box-containing protein
MHYMGMLALVLPIPVFYHYPTVVVSLLATIVASAVALYALCRKDSGLAASIVSSLVMTIGVAAMHYIGMAAMRLAAMMEYRFDLIVLSAILGFTLSFLAIRLAIRFRLDLRFPMKMASALLMGAAVLSMHYMGMMAVQFRKCDSPFSTQSTWQMSSLGIVVISATTLVVMMLAILVAFVDRTLAIRVASEQAAHEGEMQFRTLAEAIPQIVWRTTSEGYTNFISRRWYEVTGMPQGSGMGDAWTEVLHPDDREPCHKKWLECMKSGDTFEVEYRLRDAEKQYRWYLDRAVPVRDSSGAITQWFGTCTDIHDKMQNQQLLESEIRQRTEALIEANSNLESVMRERALAQQELNLQTKTTMEELTGRSNRATTLVKMAHLLQSCDDMADMLSVVAGMAPKTFPQLRGCVLLLNAAQDSLEVASSWSECRIPRPVFAVSECWAMRTGHMHMNQDGDSIVACKHVHPGETDCFCLPLISQGKYLGVVHFQAQVAGVLREPLLVSASMFAEQVGLSISNLRLREALRSQSIRDPLTGLFNRRYLEETLEREARRAARAAQSLSVIMLDLDHFKKFNDSYGHDAGDTVLRETAASLTRSVRGEDIVCRYGGEEFVIILPTADLESAHMRAEKIRCNCRELTVVHQGRSVGLITASLGVAALPLHGATPAELLDAADAALYRAKEQGRDRVIDAVSDTSEPAPPRVLASSASPGK